MQIEILAHHEELHTNRVVPMTQQSDGSFVGSEVTPWGTLTLTVTPLKSEDQPADTTEEMPTEEAPEMEPPAPLPGEPAATVETTTTPESTVEAAPAVTETEGEEAPPSEQTSGETGEPLP